MRSASHSALMSVLSRRAKLSAFWSLSWRAFFFLRSVTSYHTTVLHTVYNYRRANFYGFFHVLTAKVRDGDNTTIKNCYNYSRTICEVI